MAGLRILQDKWCHSGVTTTTLGTSTMTTGYPGSNARTPDRKQRARAADNYPIFKYSLASAQYMDTLVIVSSSLEYTATAQILASNVAEGTGELLNLQNLPVWDSIVGAGEGRASDWLGGGYLSNADLATQVPAGMVRCISFPLTRAKYWSVVLSNPGIPTYPGYLDFGRVYFARSWEMPYRPRYGLNYKNTDQSQIKYAVDGTAWVDERPRRREMECEIYLPDAQAWWVFQAAINEIGAGTPFVVWTLPEAGIRGREFFTTMYCHYEEPPSLAIEGYNHNVASLRLVEDL